MSALRTGGRVGEEDKSWQQNSGSRWVLPDQAAGHRYFITDQAVLLICVSSHPCTLLSKTRTSTELNVDIWTSRIKVSKRPEFALSLCICAHGERRNLHLPGSASPCHFWTQPHFQINCHFVFFFPKCNKFLDTVCTLWKHGTFLEDQPGP